MNIHPDNPLEFLSDARLTGIYALTSDQADRLEDYAEELNFTYLEADLTGVKGKTELLEIVGKDLRFPEWYGANYDALHDCLTDLSWCEASGYIMVIRGIAESEILDELDSLKEILVSAIEYWQAQEIPCWVFLEMSAPEEMNTTPPAH